MLVHLRLTAVVLGFAVVTPATAASDLAQPNSQDVVYHGASFPLVIGDGQRMSAVDQATDGGTGFEAAYSHGGASTTIRVYKWNKTKIPDDLRGPLLTREFNTAKHAILSVRSGGGIVRPGREFTVADDRNVPRLICAPYVMQQGRMSSQTDAVRFAWDYIVCLGALNGEFFKTSTRIGHLPDSVAEVRRFLDALVDHHWK